jgi:hypothetical protein
MSFCKHVALGVGLAAGLWCVLNGVFPAVPPAGSTAVAQPPHGNPWDAIEWVERRYKIEALRFKCRDETGVDWPGSDEVMIETVDAKGWTVSDEIKNIDSRDTHDFDPAKSCIVGVRPGIVVLGKTSVADDRGEPAPLWFEVEFWEKDLFGYPTGFCVPLGPGPGRHAGPHCVNDGNGDDFIGRCRLDFAAWELEAALPNIGDELIETVVLSPCSSSEDVCDSGWGPWDKGEYTFTYRITRLRDVRIDLRSVLDEARRTSGILSEVEAIAAGLRSLRAPTPRVIEPEPEA